MTLPAPFAALEPFVAEWALPTMAARRDRRLSSSAAERASFYAAMSPLIADVMTHLSRVPLQELPDADRPLLHLALCLAEVSLTIEVFDPAVEARHAPWSRLVTVQREMDGL